MEFIASESSALLVLSIQHVSIHTQSYPLLRANVQQSLILADAPDSPPSPSRALISWKVCSS